MGKGNAQESVSPKSFKNFEGEADGELWVEEVEGSDDEGVIPEEFRGEVCERVGAPKIEAGIVKKMKDTRLPSQRKHLYKRWKC